ncbi:hypothetical protein ACIA8G_17595 [Lentzea sp. NPDC051213]|uniref:hypothetical protein n=1 Tax=Lentzea sp. NPDC051213 TaxID=3364126 RepID=UPI0037A367BC
MKVTDLIELAGFAGASVMLKIDGERATKRWTVVVSGPDLEHSYRCDVNRLDQALARARTALVQLPGDWSWLDDPIDDLDSFAEHYEELGRRGEVVIIDRRGEQRVGFAP